MSGAQEVVKRAVFEIEPLLAELIEGKYEDNEVALGRLLLGETEIQVQLKITTRPMDFLFDEEF